MTRSARSVNVMRAQDSFAGTACQEARAVHAFTGGLHYGSVLANRCTTIAVTHESDSAILNKISHKGEPMLPFKSYRRR
jgi:hypothetical protein